MHPSRIRAPEGSYVWLENTHAGNNDLIVFTTDGKTPAIKNGEIVTGTIYDPAVPIAIDPFERKSTVAFKAIIVNSLNAASKAACVKVKTPVPAAAPVKIKTVTLNSKKETLEVLGETGGTVELDVDTLKDAEGNARTLDEVEHQWFSNHPEIADVSDDGLVTARSAGSAKITLKMLDGSNKTAVCNVTVNALVDKITIVGAAGITVNENTGNVSAAADVPAGTVFTLTAKAKDDSETTAAVQIAVVEKAKSVKLVSDDTRVVKDKTGAAKSAVIFSVDLPDEAHPIKDNQIALEAQIAENDLAPNWSSSNEKVATVDENGLVTAHKAGSAKITATASDGSGKKATFSLTVNTPISSMSMDGGVSYVITAGKSVDVSKMLMYGKTYGKPTKMKSEWSISRVLYQEGSMTIDITEEALNAKAVSVNSSGKLSTNLKKLNQYLASSSVIVTVTAKSKDGTGYTASQDIVVRKPFEYLFFCSPASEDANKPITSLTISVPKGSDYGEVSGYVFCDQDLNLTAVTSNPDICAAELSLDSTQGIYHDPKTDTDITGYFFKVKYMVYKQRTSATITMKTNDGSSASKKLKITVVNAPEE